MKLTIKQKKLWNEAVKTTLREVVKYDGINLYREDERIYLKESAWRKLSYKKL
jgi:hypothetical protein